ncbi:MAG: hypothetical protein IJH64_10295 [Oscillospiraceae bacterium]|nr:hypothetical protein [Oscillospiraceae bacterium]MBR0452294.1 hypothetical protein [Oscillospiraceae bacterium]
MGKSKIINTATCDARCVTEDSLAGFDNITINSALLIVGERSKELLNQYPVTMNVATIVEVPDGQDIAVKSINGKGEIGPDADGTGVLLMVNGKVVITDGSREAVKNYYRIMVNGKVLMPKSYEGQFSNLQVNGKAEYYPDGATILKTDTRIDDLFISRAANSLYYCSGNLFFLDTGIDAEAIASKGFRFAAKKVVVAESLTNRLVSMIDEEAKIVEVPDGTRLIDDDLELKMKTIKKYGPKLCVTGDVSIKDAEALASLEYLFADGTVSVNKELEDAFDEIESVYDELRIIDPNLGYITDRPIVKVGAVMLRKYPSGVRVEDCAKVTLSKDLTPDDIMEKLHIEDCAVVTCTKEQEEAVSMISEDVARIKITGQNPEDEEDEMVAGTFGSFLGKLKDTQMINAVEYKM